MQFVTRSSIVVSPLLISVITWTRIALVLTAPNRIAWYIATGGAVGASYDDPARSQNSLQGNAQFEEWPLPGPGVPGLLWPAWKPQPRRPLVTPLWILPYYVPTQPAPVIYNQTFLDSNITMNFSGKKVALRASSLAAPLEKKTIAFVSGHIFCQCSVEDTKVLLPFKPLLEPQTEVAGRRISSSASDHNSFTVASTIPKLLVGNLTLLPGEELDVLYSEVIPESNCPSFRGLAVRYSWKLAFHCQILGQATTVIHIPLWIMILPEIEKDLLSNGDGLRRTSNDDSAVDGNLPEDTTLHPHNGNGEDEVFASNGPLNLQLALQSLDELTKKRNPKVFNIDCQYGKLGTLTLSKIKFRLGEEIYGKFDFTDKSVTCIQYLVSLIGDEHICEDHRKPKGIAFSENIVSKAHDFCVCLQQSTFSLPIPLHITPSFSSEIIELKWKLRFEFVLSTEAFHLDVPQVANEQQSVLWRAPVRIPVESITWNLPIDIYPTDPVQVHSVHLRDSLGGEVKVQL